MNIAAIGNARYVGAGVTLLNTRPVYVYDERHSVHKNLACFRVLIHVCKHVKCTGCVHMQGFMRGSAVTPKQ